jgi:hypothetical protein
MNYFAEQTAAFTGAINGKPVRFFDDPNRMRQGRWVANVEFCEALGMNATQRYELFDRIRIVPIDSFVIVNTAGGSLTLAAPGVARIVVRKMIERGVAPASALAEFEASLTAAESAIGTSARR